MMQNKKCVGLFWLSFFLSYIKDLFQNTQLQQK